jgi:excisionase family DNA binding protein
MAHHASTDRPIVRSVVPAEAQAARIGTEAGRIEVPDLDPLRGGGQQMDPAQEVLASQTPSVETVSLSQIALTVRQVAQLLGMTPKAVYHRAARGQLPGKFYVGRSLRFRRADLLRFIAEGRGLSPTRSR